MAFSGALTGTFADQWKEIITAPTFGEHDVVVPGVVQRSNNGRGSNYFGSVDVISNGSKIFVPENTAAFIFNQAGIDSIIVEPGGYTFESGEKSIFDGGGLSALTSQIADRFAYGGQSASQTRIAFVNLREIRGIKYGTHGPMMYHDLFYDTDLSIQSYGNFSIRVVDAKKFILNFIPANATSYSFDMPGARSQLISEFLLSYMVAINALSNSYRIAELPSKAQEIAEKVMSDEKNAGSWEKRFGFIITKIGIENIEFSDESKRLIENYNSNKMNLKAYENISEKASNIGAQQKIAEGIKEHGLGNGAGMIFGMNLASGLNNNASSKKENEIFDKQVENLQKLKSLLDAGILTEEEFQQKKREILGL